MDRLIDKVCNREFPECPGNLEPNVLRRVRLDGARVDNSFWDWMCGFELRSRTAMAVLSLVILASSLVTALSISRKTDNLDRFLEARTALDLVVFDRTELINFHEMERRND